MSTKVRRRSRDRRPRTIRRPASLPAIDTTSTPAGHAVLSDEVWRHLVGILRLSGRESEILQAVFDDQKESTIAVNLGISTHTVHTHLERLYRKLRVTSRVGLVVRVVAEHLSNRPS